MERSRTTQEHWDETPYGKKRNTAQNAVIIQIDPGKNTALGRKPEELDRSGLRGHPETLKETIRVLSGEPHSLKYTARAEHEENVNIKYFGPGEVFHSVESDGKGYWHTLENVSKTKPIALEITVTKK